jgi:hypothetical protein
MAICAGPWPPSKQLGDLYGLAPEGELAPADAVADPSTNGLIGSPTHAPPYYRLTSPVAARTGSPYHLQYRDDARGHPVTEAAALALQPGWQMVTQLLGGQKHSWIVDGV